MDIIHGTALLEPDEQRVFRTPIATEVGELACGQVIDKLLHQRSSAQVDITRAEVEDDDSLRMSAEFALQRTDDELKIAHRVAAPALVHELEDYYDIPHEAAGHSNT